jgi:hypothetical protein
MALDVSKGKMQEVWTNKRAKVELGDMTHHYDMSQVMS